MVSLRDVAEIVVWIDIGPKGSLGKVTFDIAPGKTRVGVL